MKEQITEKKHPTMYNWLVNYNNGYIGSFVLDNGIIDIQSYNFNHKNSLFYIKYPFNIKMSHFACNDSSIFFIINFPYECYSGELYNMINLLSFKGFPKKITTKNKIFINDNKLYSLNYKFDSEKYKIYLLMWLEMLDSVIETERWNYINEFKDKKNDYNDSLIPKELLIEFGVL